MASLSTILSWFKTGFKPTENQFAQCWSSFWHKDDIIPQTSVSGLQTALSNLTSSIQSIDTITFSENGIYVIPAGKMITLLVVECNTTQILNIGNDIGGTELLDGAELPGSFPYAIRLDIIADSLNSRTIYFHGFAGEVKIHFHKLKYL
jgi:hypothetical protein